MEVLEWVDRIHVEVSGPEGADPIVLLHGWGSSAALMQPLAKGLQDIYRVFNIDLPGHGETPPPPEPWGVPEFGALVVEVIREQIGRPVHMVGHSNGGRISLYLASESNYSAWIKSLALISPSGIKASRSMTYYLKKSLATVLKAPFQVFPRGLKEYGLDWLRHTLVWRLLGSSDYQQLSGSMRGTFVKTVNFYVEDLLGRIEVPVLLFWGTSDEAVSKQQMVSLDQGLHDSALIELEGASHYGYLDKPDVVIPAIRHFFSHVPA